ncbi:pentapeptide repeat-containing protein [Mycolicibacterium obuense]|uniref:pentapeptide repeat-containing protein n=1 Tax=Mycolicibacterium obuense TaxID=1807 RepID=UPI00140D3A0C|nr:pentapeptide repeat-containing protein [Mycolicibacterium obuense]
MTNPSPGGDEVERDRAGQVVEPHVETTESATSTPKPAEPQTATQEAEAAIKERAGEIALGWLIGFGTLGALLLGGAMFAWLAWLFSKQPAPWRDQRGLWAWLSEVSGESYFDAARTTATLLAVVGLGGAALVAYRRQATAELTYGFTVRAHAVAIDAQKTAAEQLSLDSRKYDLDRERHDLETLRRDDDRQRELRSRFATIAAQLGSDQYAVRHAGVVALASMADDWHRFGNDLERQACIDLFCAQLRRSRVPNFDERSIRGEVVFGEWTPEKRSQDTEIRKAMIALIRSRRPLIEDSDDNWNACSLDLTGADLSGFYFNETNLRSVNFDDANLSNVNMIGSDLSNAQMARVNVTRANFSNAVMVGTRLFSIRIDGRGEDNVAEKVMQQRAAQFNHANMEDARLTNAYLPYCEFEEANLTGARMDFATLNGADFMEATLRAARMRSANLSGADFRRADLRDAAMSNVTNVAAAKFDDARHNIGTRWPKGERPNVLESPEEPEDVGSEENPG